MRYGDFTPAGPFNQDFFLHDESDTDPNQEWRNETRAEDELRWSEDERPPGIELRSYEPETTVRTSGYKPGSPASIVPKVAPTVIGLLVLGMLVEGAMIFNLYRQQHKIPDVPHQVPVVVPADMSVAHAYNAPKLVMDTPVMPDILQISPQGNPLVVSLDGLPETYIINKKEAFADRRTDTLAAGCATLESKHGAQQEPCRPVQRSFRQCLLLKSRHEVHRDVHAYRNANKPGPRQRVIDRAY